MTDINLSGIWDRIRQELKDAGVELDAGCCESEDGGGGRIKVVCMAGGLGDSLKEMGKTLRDQVLMVRIDDDTIRKLDAWLETGAFRSRSEAAALFIREGLKVHARELDDLKDALQGVEAAKDRLKEEARSVFESAATETASDEPAETE